MDEQAAYWERVAPDVEFTYPIDLALFRLHVSRPDRRILDVGCGYGRTLVELEKRGYTDLKGIDASPAMIERGRATYPALDLEVADATNMPFSDDSFEIVLMVALLTSVPDDDDQKQIVREVKRVLVPGGLLFVSDLLMQRDERNRARYDVGESLFGKKGVFRIEDGLVCRHHSLEWIRELLDGFQFLQSRFVSSETMHSHPVQLYQALYRLPI